MCSTYAGLQSWVESMSVHLEKVDPDKVQVGLNDFHLLPFKKLRLIPAP